MRTKSRIRHKKQLRIHRQAAEHIIETMSADQRKIIRFSREQYTVTDISRELALPQEYVWHFMAGLMQRLTHDGLIPSSNWNNVLKWADEEGLTAPHV